MADYSRGDRHDRGERGGYGGNRQKKRRYHDDDERDYRQQRPRYDDPVVRLRKDVLSVAESPLIKVEDTIRNIALSFLKSYDNENVQTSFINLLKKLIIEQPFKIPFVAAIILVANSKNEEVGKQIVEEFRSHAQGYLDECQWRPFKLILRFLACLSSLFSDDGIMILLDDVANFAGEVANGGSSNGLAEELSRIVLITLPYIKSSAPGVISEESINRLIEKVATIPMSPPFEAQLAPYHGENSPFGEAENVVSLLLKQVQDEAVNGWSAGILPRPWEVFRADLEAATKHTFPILSLPTHLQGETIYPEIYFSVFASQEVETVPPRTNIAYSILKDTISDTINLLEFNRVSVARFLVDVDCYFAPDAFVKRATSFDKIKEMSGDRSTWKPEDIAVDAVFSFIFQLPQPEHKLVYYHSVLTEICKLAPQAVAPSLGRSIRFLYRHIDCMDVELRYRFIDWFAHHLSNFGFTWKWMEWAGDLSLSPIHPKRSFISEALEKEIRLSFPNRVKGTLPETYTNLVPAETEKEVPEFKFGSDVTFSEEGKAMIGLIRKRAQDTEVDSLMAEITEKAKSQGLLDPGKYGREIYVTAICHIGAKSLSHVLSCIERCKDRLAAIGTESPLAQREIVNTVMNYWSDQPGIGANVVDKLLNYSILTPLSIIEWVLMDAGRKILARGHSWEMVNTTTRKVIARTKNLASAKAVVGLPEEQVTLLDEGYEVASTEQAASFKCVVDALTSYQSTDYAGDDGSPEEQEILRWWAGNWLRALKRKFEIEQGVESSSSESKQNSEDMAVDAV